jgi:hypothetical protein
MSGRTIYSIAHEIKARYDKGCLPEQESLEHARTSPVIRKFEHQSEPFGMPRGRQSRNQLQYFVEVELYRNRGFFTKASLYQDHAPVLNFQDFI